MKYLLTILCCLYFSAKGALLTVGVNGQYQTIGKALAASGHGDSIFVYSGIYKEKNLEIYKKIYLLGIGRPVLDGEKLYEILSIKSDGVTVDGFVLQHTGISSMVDYAAIKIYNRRCVTISNNIIKDAFFGIYSQYGINCVIRNNTLIASSKEEQQSANGIHCWKSDSMQIIGNSVTGHRDGIYFEFVTNSIIWRNRSFKNMRYGLHFMFSNNDAYIGNLFEENGAGVAVMFSSGVKMFNNYFHQNWGDAAYGILLKEISDSYIEGNHFEENTIAIYAEGASRISLIRNVFRANGWAFKMQASCMDLNVEANNFFGNTFDISTNGSLVLNRFANNFWDKYEGYDLDRNSIGDIPYRPVSLYAIIVEQNPPAIILFRSFITSLLDKTEKILPTLIPIDLKDNNPQMKPLAL